MNQQICMQCQIYDNVFMHGSRCTVQVQVTNILLDRVVIAFQCPGPTQFASLKKWVLQMIGQLCVCEHKRFKNGIHRLINVYSKILLYQLYTYAGTQSLQTSNIMVRETNPSLYSLVQRLETPRGAMNSCTIESDLVDKASICIQCLAVTLHC